MESEKTRPHTKAEDGEYYGGRPALGYKSKNKALKEDKEGLKVYQLIKQLRGRGRYARSYAKIADLSASLQAFA